VEGTLTVTPGEVADFIRRAVREFRDNPLLNLSSLAYAGMVIASIGFVKNHDALKLLGDLVSDAPDKLRNLISLRYSVLGTLGEVQAILSDVTDDAIRRITRILLEVADMFEKGSLNDSRLLHVIGELYELLAVKLPSVATPNTE